MGRRNLVVLQSLSWVWLFVTPWTVALEAPLSSTVSRSLLQFISVESVMLSSHLILCCPLLFWPSIIPSIRIFSNESVLCIRWPKYWHFSFNTSNEYSGFISFRNDWFDLLEAYIKALDMQSLAKWFFYWTSVYSVTKWKSQTRLDFFLISEDLLCK